MNRDSVDWYGYIPAITTPFTRDGELDLDGFEKQIDWLAHERMQGVILAGTTGEWFSLSEAERAELFAQGSKNSPDDMIVLGRCNAFTAAEAVRHAHAAERAGLDGLDGILLTPPPYIVPTRAEVVAFYEEVSDATSIPICIYNWPRGCVVDLDIDLLGELAEIENVVAIKNCTGDMSRFVNGLYELSDRVRYFGVPTNAFGADLTGLCPSPSSRVAV